MKIIGSNGIWTDGADNIDLMLQALHLDHGYQVADIKSIRRNPFTARFCAGEDSQKIVEAGEDGDAVVAHSYGCLKTVKAAEHVEFSHLFLFGAAVNDDWDFRNISKETKIWNFHSRSDWVLLIGSLLIVHPFGNGGRTGFKDPRVTNIECKNHGHSTYFKTGKLAKYEEFIHCTIRDGDPRNCSGLFNS